MRWGGMPPQGMGVEPSAATMAVTGLEMDAHRIMEVCASSGTSARVLRIDLASLSKCFFRVKL